MTRTTHGPKANFLAGVRDMSPVVLGAAPFGVVYGVAAVSSGLAEGPALAMSVVVFAGAAQLAGVGLLAEQAQLAVIWLTVFVIHLRYVMYSAALAPHFQGLPKRWKVLLAYPMTDQAFALSIVRFQNHPDDPAKHLYYLGNALTLWPAWVLSSAVGIFLGAQIPARWGLEFAVPLAFLAVIFPLDQRQAERPRRRRRGRRGSSRLRAALQPQPDARGPVRYRGGSLR